VTNAALSAAPGAGRLTLPVEVVVVSEVDAPDAAPPDAQAVVEALREVRSRAARRARAGRGRAGGRSKGTENLQRWVNRSPESYRAPISRLVILVTLVTLARAHYRRTAVRATSSGGNPLAPSGA
jgi:hypothetical protein